MNILSWRGRAASNRASPKGHMWTVYLNPRNKKIQISACSQCGILKSAELNQTICAKIPDRSNNALLNKGWVEQGLAS